MSNSAKLNASSPAEFAKVVKNYYAQATSWRYDPLHDWSQFWLTAGVLFLLALLCRHWKTLANWVSEDSTLRCDRFSVYYWGILQCCGACDGEWTRYFSLICCYCCQNLRGRNLKRLLGELVGWSAVPVRVQNITLGNLPPRKRDWFPRAPDVFVQIFADELQPTLSTEVVQEANPNCVQFTTSLTMMIKNHLREDPVHIVVRQMRVFGSSEIADCYISPTRLISWARKRRKVRVQLRPSHEYDGPAHCPWILLDLSVPPELPFLRTAPGSFAPVVKSEGRTANVEMEEAFNMGSKRRSVTQDDFEPLTHHGSCYACFACTNKAPGKMVLLPVQASAEFKQYTAKREFRTAFPLVNDQGAPVLTEFEEDALNSESLRLRGYVRVSLCVLTCVVLAYSVCRFLSITCYEEYRQLGVVWRWAIKEERQLPLKRAERRYVQNDLCKMKRHDVLKFFSRVGRNLKKKFTQKVPKEVCSMNRTETIEFCRAVPPNLTAWYSTVPLVFNFVPCPWQSCEIDGYLNEADSFVISLICIWTCVACLAQYWVQRHIREALQKPTSERFVDKFMDTFNPTALAATARRKSSAVLASGPLESEPTEPEARSLLGRSP